MQLRLILMRHAESAPSSAALDHARPITDTGRADALGIAHRLVGASWLPSGVVASDARRARETYESMDPVLQAGPARYSRSLYLGRLEDIRAVVGSRTTVGRTALVIGHNPGWEEAVLALTARPIFLRPATAVLMEAEGDRWKDALGQTGTWTCVDVLRP